MQPLPFATTTPPPADALVRSSAPPAPLTVPAISFQDVFSRANLANSSRADTTAEADVPDQSTPDGDTATDADAPLSRRELAAMDHDDQSLVSRDNSHTRGAVDALPAQPSRPSSRGIDPTQYQAPHRGTDVRPPAQPQLRSSDTPDVAHIDEAAQRHPIQTATQIPETAAIAAPATVQRTGTRARENTVPQPLDMTKSAILPTPVRPVLARDAMHVAEHAIRAQQHAFDPIRAAPLLPAQNPGIADVDTPGPRVETPMRGQDTGLHRPVLAPDQPVRTAPPQPAVMRALEQPVPTTPRVVAQPVVTPALPRQDSATPVPPRDVQPVPTQPIPSKTTSGEKGQNLPVRPAAESTVQQTQQRTVPDLSKTVVPHKAEQTSGRIDPSQRLHHTTPLPQVDQRTALHALPTTPRTAFENTPTPVPQQASAVGNPERTNQTRLAQPSASAPIGNAHSIPTPTETAAPPRVVQSAQPFAPAPVGNAHSIPTPTETSAPPRVMQPAQPSTPTPVGNAHPIPTPTETSAPPQRAQHAITPTTAPEMQNTRSPTSTEGLQTQVTKAPLQSAPIPTSVVRPAGETAPIDLPRIAPKTTQQQVQTGQSIPHVPPIQTPDRRAEVRPTTNHTTPTRGETAPSVTHHTPPAPTAPPTPQGTSAAVQWHMPTQPTRTEKERSEHRSADPLFTTSRADPSAPQTHLATPTRTELPPQVARQLVDVVSQMPNRPVEITLSPEELGRVRLTVKASDTGVIVNVLAERPETLDLLRRHIDQLGQDFQSLGYENIAFSFADSNADTDANTDEDTSDTDLMGSSEAPIETTEISLRSAATSGLDLRL